MYLDTKVSNFIQVVYCMPKVSIIIPVYNVERYVSRCVRSLFEQTLDDIEFIFVDDASPDDSIAIIKSILLEYPNRQDFVRFIKHETNKGLSAARYSGLKVANGEYIAHCDSDDWVDINMYSILYKEAKLKEADIVTCNFYFSYQTKNEKVKQIPVLNEGERTSTLCQYMITGMTPVWNMIAKRHLYTAHHISPTIGINYCEDFILSVKLFHKASNIVHLDKALYFYNQQNTSSLLRSRRIEASYEEVKAYLDVINYLKKEEVYAIYAKQLCWRMLRAKQEWILDIQYHKLFMITYPESHKYILSCPLINNKLKCMMWCKTHYLTLVTKCIIVLRKFLKR